MSDEHDWGRAGTSTVTETNLADLMVASARRGVRVVWSSDAALVGEVFEVEGTLTLGRDLGAASGVVVRDERMSRKHASITRQNERLPIYEVRDLESKNGTYVDGQRVPSHFVGDGAVVRVGATVLLFGQLPETPRPLDPPFVGVSEKLAAVLHQTEQLARSDISVLVQGETGTGKELVAQRIHDLSGRKGSFRALNCAAVPATLMESTLFGHRRGAFTGAETQIGVFQEAADGTLFLDEIGELPLDLQPKLLRVLENGEYTPLGQTGTLRSSARIVAATNRDLPAEVKAGRFRSDLLARLRDLPIAIPPLRERRDDILPLAQHFLRQEQPEQAFDWTTEAVEALLLYPWPMNARELRTAMRLARLRAADGQIRLQDLPGEVWGAQDTAPDAYATESSPPQPARPRASRPPDREALEQMLRDAAGNVAQVAKLLGKDRKQVYRWLEKCGIDPEKHRS